ncbi:MAG TPA: hypothetical protein VMZ91_12025 [Candidatus Paceibacterota bacterium]|nr:hypothetical protein [Candidatus Paceibacterota bacterium]
MPTKKEIGNWINKNRPIIDEFLCPNNPGYTAIALKGQILKLIGKEDALKFFSELMNSGKSQTEQNIILHQKLSELRNE